MQGGRAKERTWPKRMAGDWMKVEKDTPEKPEILALAAALSITPDEAFGKCFRFWRWADSQLVDGNARGVTQSVIDALVGRHGFADVLLEVGWLQVRNGSLVIPNFERHMSQTAKSRALTANRVSQHKKRKGNARVTLHALPREEKRIEEIHNKPPPPPSGIDSKTIRELEEVVFACGVEDGSRAVRTALQAGCTPKEIHAVVGAWGKRMGDVSAAYLHWRLMHLRPGELPDKGWPAPEPDVEQKAATAKRLDRERQAEAEYAEQASKSAATAAEREAKFGPELDAMDQLEVEELCRSHPPMHKMFKKKQPSPLLREWLLVQLERRVTP